MRHIVPTIPREYDSHVGDPSKISSSSPILIATFRDLVEVVAKFAYHSKDYMLFFRGQSRDYLNKAGNSTFYPTIYRGDYLSHRDIRYRLIFYVVVAKLFLRHSKTEN